jgi:hypothetical protein
VPFQRAVKVGLADVAPGADRVREDVEGNHAPSFRARAAPARQLKLTR